MSFNTNLVVVSRFLLRVWTYLVLMLTVIGAGLSAFGLYTTAIMKAPLKWFDKVIGPSAASVLLGALLVFWVVIGIIMLHFGARALAAIGGAPAPPKSK